MSLRVLDPFAALVDESRRWTPDWYGWADKLSRMVLEPCTVAQLPAAGTNVGVRGFVTDATATGFMSVATGGGANKVPVVSNGTNWIIG
jgi:hypothetical protein